MAFIQNRLVSPFPLEVVVDFQEAGAISKPTVLRAVREIQLALDREPTIGRTLSVVDLVDEMNRALNPDHAADGLPEERDLVAQYLVLLEMIGPDEVRRLVNSDQSKIRISALTDDAGSAILNPMLDRVDSLIVNKMPDGAQSIRTGTVVLASTVSGLVTESLLFSIGLAFVFISLIMALLYRSTAMLIISLVPNIFPLVLVAGFMAAAGIDIKPATAVIFSIAFGIAVDDTIHFLARLRQESARGRPMEEAIHISMLGTGKAIVLTSIILIGGFLTLSTSQFQSSTYMGILISLSILGALIADLIVLPSLLHGWLTFFSKPYQREIAKKWTFLKKL